MKNETAQSVVETSAILASVGQRNELVTVLTQAIPEDLSSADAQAIIGSKKSFKHDILAVFAQHSVELIKRAIFEWQTFYQEMFGENFDFSQVRIPERREGFDRLIIVAQGMTAQRVFNSCADLFGIGKYTDRSLDEVVFLNERDSKNGHYAIWVRDVVEADEVHRNKSARQIADDGLETETLLERLLQSLMFYKQTGQNLDNFNRTLCAGSRDSDGNVPSVGWDGHIWLYVDWCYPGRAYDYLRVREVVSN